MIQRQDVTGLVLAGGRGSRMGGVDKGLQRLDGAPLVQHALRRLQPQVGQMLINANRNLEVYEGFGVPVRADAVADYAGPLAGFLAGLSQCETEWLVTVPCDTPRFPADLVARLASGIGEAPVAVAVTVTDGVRQRESVFCLLRRELRHDLQAHVRGGGHKIQSWLERHGCVDVVFEDTDAFFNANTLEELGRLGGA